MWFRRFIAWVRTLLSASPLDNESNETTSYGAPFGGAVPPVEPEFTRRQLFYPRDSFKTFGFGAPHESFTLEPTAYESPKTVPLMRLSPQVELRHAEPTQPLPVASEPPAPPPTREPARESVASEPLSASLQRLSNLPDSVDAFDLMDDLDDTTRRLLFLRRLVRQRVYNEGFTLGETPAQYRHSLGMGDDLGETGSQN